MFWKLVREPFRRPRSRRRALWAMLAIALGTAVAAAMLSVSLDVGDRVGSELRSLGANIVITPAADTLPVEIGGIDFRPVSEGAYIPESSLPQLKKIFWGNNIIAFAPYLYAPARLNTASASLSTTLVGTWFDYPVVLEKGAVFRTGVGPLNPSWQLEGSWPRDMEPSEADHSSREAIPAALGRSLAENLGAKVGDTVAVELNSDSSHALRAVGIVTAGGAEDTQVFVPLSAVQAWTSLAGKVRKVQVSALIKPEDELSRKGPERMTPAEYDRWYCSPYISSILHQIGEALPGTVAAAVRQVAETQGTVLSKLTFLMGLLTVVALLAAGLSISSLASLTVLERREEIGLMKALGAGNGTVAGFFLAEMAVQGIGGGVLGFVAGQFLARWLGRAVFGTEIEIHWLVLPLILLVALVVSLAGTYPPVRRAVREDPARVLRSA